MHVQVVVFSWTRCPFCLNAKALLDSKGAKYTAVELDKMDDGNAIRAQLAEVSLQPLDLGTAYLMGRPHRDGCASDDESH